MQYSAGLLVWTVSCRLSLFTVRHAVFCWYAEDSTIVEVFLVLVFVIIAILREREIIPPLPNPQPG
jgi:hypothetical protein